MNKGYADVLLEDDEDRDPFDDDTNENMVKRYLKMFPLDRDKSQRENLIIIVMRELTKRQGAIIGTASLFIDE